MAYKAADGREFTNRMALNQHQASLRGQGMMPEQRMPATQQDGKGGQGNIEDDPKAMQLVDQLKQMGYTGEDVERAMGDDGGEAEPSNAQAVKAASLNIPGA